MGSIVVKPNQTFLDVVVMGCGTLEAAMAFAEVNGLSITSHLSIGQELAIPAPDKLEHAGITPDSITLKYLQQNAIVIGTKATLWVAGGFVDETSTEEFVLEDDEALVRE